MAQVDAKRNIKLLFARPFEPVFVKKEFDEGSVSLDVPQDFYTDRFSIVSNSLSSRAEIGADRTVQVHEIQHPDLKFTEKIPIKGGFSLFNPVHQEIAGELVRLLLDQPDTDAFFTTAAYIRDRINPYLYQVRIG